MGNNSILRFNELPSDWKSNYLETGFSEDKPEFKNVTVDLEKKIISAEITMGSYYDHGNGFHLTIPTAHRIAVQLINAYLCAHYGIDKSEMGTVTAIDISVRCKKPINSTMFAAEVTCEKIFERGELAYGRFSYSLGSGDFIGYAKGIAANPKLD
jgi:hypothetical protein